MARILILDTHDSHLGGHGWSTYIAWKSEGHDVCFVSLYRKNYETENYFYDLTTWYGRIWYFISYYIFDLFVKKILLRPELRYNFVSSYLFGKSAKDILKKCPFTPDYIFITWVPNFITAKTVHDLSVLTNAKIVLSMVDEAILSLCHYHKDCDGYINGCNDCPHVRGLKKIPRYVIKEREKYWSDIPFVVRATTYDINFAKRVSYLRNATFQNVVKVLNFGEGVQKNVAREYFGISNEDFVIFIGANDVANPDKGYPYVVEAINKMMPKIQNIQREITLLILGHNVESLNLDLDSRVNVVKRDFLPKEHFLKAYYACDVHASATLYDAGPMMVNYAMACGRPVVSFNVGIALDLIENGVTGYIADFKDTDQFSDALLKIFGWGSEKLLETETACKAKIESFKDRNYKIEL